ncbi:MAG: DUF885 family protein [Bryobacteraceae bacterium]
MRPFLLCLLMVFPLAADDLTDLSNDFWNWRVDEQPFSEDDIPRLDRSQDFVIDWSPEKVAQRRTELAAFETRWKALDVNGESISNQVDYRLIGSALARARWELDIERGWQRNPVFYVQQTLGSFQLLLLPPPPFDAARQAELVKRMKSIPGTIQSAEANLTDMRQPFAKLAIDALADVPVRFAAMVNALGPQLDETTRQALLNAMPPAIDALERFRSWLQGKLESLPTDTAIGRENYEFFLKQVALLPYSPEQLLAMGRQEWERSVAFESYERLRNANLPELALFPSQAAQIEREAKDEQKIRDYLNSHNLLTVPAWMRHYRNLPLPDYLRPFSSLGVTDDLTGPARLTQNGTSYIRHPSPSLGYFALSTAKDPRPIIVHEGVPGHYFQLTLGWTHEDPIRRHYYDSGANEGIGFYAEEMMLQAGLFDDSPRTREIIYSFMRLRALRVEVDVKLALGQFTLDQAADYLARTVPMDATTAREEAAMFASTPGQAISYQIGKLQIMKLLAETREKQGDSFSLRAFHDSLWKNGNVPISLQRWEMLGDMSDVPAVALAKPEVSH